MQDLALPHGTLMIAAEFQDARHSVDIVADVDPNTRGPNGLGGWVDALVRWVNPALRRRCVLHLAEQAHPLDVNRNVLDTCRQTGWSVRTTTVAPSDDMFVIDESRAFSVLGRYPENTVKVDHGTGRSDPLISHVQTLWQSGSEAVGIPELLYEDLIRSTSPAEGARIARISLETWDRVIAELLNSPTDLRKLVAKAFRRTRCRVIDPRRL
jgi:hypothetical protein